MTTTTHHCDRCDQEILVDRTFLKVIAGPPSVLAAEFDLCLHCLTAFKAWLREGKIEKPSGRS